MARAMSMESEAVHWDELAASLPDYALSPNREMKFAPTLAYNQSHRHFSHLLAIYPLGLIRWEDGDSSREVIRKSLRLVDSIGPSQWTGYSYAWQAALKARARDGNGAAKALTTFADGFCSINGFHVNGDQSGKNYSSFKYRPFTLEGNFAFAAGVQEMMIQSHTDTILVMPAVPESWQNIAFTRLRSEGGFLISATKENGKVKQVVVTADVDGFVYIRIPYPNYSNRVLPVVGKPTKKTTVNGVMRMYLTKGSVVEINPTKWPY
jgi:hypothetical protein